MKECLPTARISLRSAETGGTRRTASAARTFSRWFSVVGIIAGATKRETRYAPAIQRAAQSKILQRARRLAGTRSDRCRNEARFALVRSVPEAGRRPRSPQRLTESFENRNR